MLPNQFRIDINMAKINDYLLNPDHKDSWSKAKFLQKYGFTTEENVKALLNSIIQQNDVKQTIQTKYGNKYIVEGAIANDSAVMLRTVWTVLKGENICRFVTAYPL